MLNHCRQPPGGYLAEVIVSGDVALLLGKRNAETPRQTTTDENPEAQKRKETDQQTSSKAVFNFFQLGFWVGALVLRGLGDESLPG